MQRPSRFDSLVATGVEDLGSRPDHTVKHHCPVRTGQRAEQPLPALWKPQAARVQPKPGFETLGDGCQMLASRTNQRSECFLQLVNEPGLVPARRAWDQRVPVLRVQPLNPRRFLPPSASDVTGSQSLAPQAQSF